jgi:hypothetical protein
MKISGVSKHQMAGRRRERKEERIDRRNNGK